MATFEPIITYQGIICEGTFTFSRKRGVGADFGSIILPKSLYTDLEDSGLLTLDDGVNPPVVIEDVWIDHKNKVNIVSMDDDGEAVLVRVNLRDNRWLLEEYGVHDEDAVRDINIQTFPEVTDFTSWNSATAFTTSRSGETEYYKSDTVKPGSNPDAAGSPWTVTELISQVLPTTTVSKEGSRDHPIPKNIQWRFPTKASAIQEVLKQAPGITYCQTLDNQVELWPKGEGSEPSLPSEYTETKEHTSKPVVPDVLWIVGNPILVDEEIGGLIPVGELESDYENPDGTGIIPKGTFVPLFLLDGFKSRYNTSIEQLWNLQGVTINLRGKNNTVTPVVFTARDLILLLAIYEREQISVADTTILPRVFKITDPDEIAAKVRVSRNFFKVFQIPFADSTNSNKLPIYKSRCANIAATLVNSNASRRQKQVAAARLKVLNSQVPVVEARMIGVVPNTDNTIKSPHPFKRNKGEAKFRTPKWLLVNKQSTPERPTIKDYNAGIFSFSKQLFSIKFNTNPPGKYLFIGSDIELIANNAIAPPQLWVRYTHEKRNASRGDYYSLIVERGGTIVGNGHDFFNPTQGVSPASFSPDARIKIIKDKSLTLCEVITEGGTSNFINLAAMNTEALQIADNAFEEETETHLKQVKAYGFYPVTCNGNISEVRWGIKNGAPLTEYQFNTESPLSAGPSEAEKAIFIDNSRAASQLEDYYSPPIPLPEPPSPYYQDRAVHPFFSGLANLSPEHLTPIGAITQLDPDLGITSFGLDPDDPERGPLVGTFNFAQDDFVASWTGGVIDDPIEQQSRQEENLAFRPANTTFVGQILRFLDRRDSESDPEDNREIDATT